MKVFMLLIAAFCVVNVAESKTFTRCGLAKELLRQGFMRSTLPDWVCLIEAESSRRTSFIGPMNSNGSRNYGLFQINSGMWCKIGSPGNKCGVSCESMITDDITKSSACAKKVFKESGYASWVGWKNKCRGKTLPNPFIQCGLSTVAPQIN